MEQFKGLSKKRTNPLMAEEIFHSMSSKGDLYKHLDQHLQVSWYILNPNFSVLFMSLRHVHKRLRQRDFFWAKISYQKKECHVYRCHKIWRAISQKFIWLALGIG